MCLRPHPSDAPLVPARTTSDYLEREARLIALTRALAPLSLTALADPFARAACYVAEKVGPVTDAEDAEACRRSEFYWRRVRRRPEDEGGQRAAPLVPPPLAPELCEVAYV